MEDEKIRNKIFSASFIDKRIGCVSKTKTNFKSKTKQDQFKTKMSPLLLKETLLKEERLNENENFHLKLIGEQQERLRKIREENEKNKDRRVEKGLYQRELDRIKKEKMKKEEVKTFSRERGFF